ncbi:SusD/RagB family nutrient-binding outer membrane lipoprotein [Rufibacter immobilis]|uniref:SusD/RagB family nutrient-binding outer membrane lipoprotein n=1 Tax=Rufibacter immobilis TaxID=1348778 RepID=UPI0035E4DFCE
MKKIFYAALVAATMFGSVSCESWLDVNENPNGPDGLIEPHLYLAPMQAELAIALQNDGRYIGKYINNWHQAAAETNWDRHGYTASSDAGATLWRSTYYTSGLNLVNMIASAEKDQKWEIVGIGHALQAYNWQITTDNHGEIIMSEAFDQTKSSFNYDKQEAVYAEVVKQAELALAAFEKAKATPYANKTLLGLNANSDLMYGGDINKWIKFTYGILAINASHLSNKSSYDPIKVAEYVDKSFASRADDALIRFEGTNTTNASFFGPMRGNIGSASGSINLRQSRFIVGLLDGTNAVLQDPALVGQDPETIFANQHLKDPRLPVMLSPASDGQYRGIAYAGVSDYATASQPRSLWGTTSDNPPAASVGKYIFNNNASFPIMTYAQLQFIKAEALYRSNQKAPALQAYKNGVESHMEYVKSFLTIPEERTLFDARKVKYLASPLLVPTESTLTLSHIMLQKYVAQWGWGFIETWTDLRRYHYVDSYNGSENVPGEPVPVGGDLDASDNVFRGYYFPTTAQMFSANNNMPAYRVRPRFNSEYMWNITSLQEIGALDNAYHTYEMWFSKKGQ